MYPKLILEGGAHCTADRGTQPLSSSALKRPPLARAVHLTLGVAVLGSLLGGVQLFSMIKMLGLVKEDMSSNQNEWAWYGYQVSMRILEVTLCTLLAVIATTPLRSDAQYAMGDVNGMYQLQHNGYAVEANALDYESSGCGCQGCCGPRKSAQMGSHRRRKPYQKPKTSSWLCCFNCSDLCCDSNPPKEFEDENYSEICSNNHSVRQVLQQDPGHHYSTLIRPGTAAGNMGMAVGSSSTLMVPYNHKRGGVSQPPGFQSATLLRSNLQDVVPVMALSGNSSGNNVHLSQPPSAPVLLPGGSGSSSRATIDTALYSNLRGGGGGNNTSRPSSMLFNDSGFVR